MKRCFKINNRKYLSASLNCVCSWHRNSITSSGARAERWAKAAERRFSWTLQRRDLTEATDPSRIMMRQIAGSFAQYEKARLVKKLREARERLGKLGGRKSYTAAMPETVTLA